MGHYRSEMGYEDEDAKRLAYRHRQENNTRETVRDMIADFGIEETLVKILIELRDRDVRLPSFHMID